jgi:ABC-type phosphate transport system substrate-binding protein
MKLTNLKTLAAGIVTLWFSAAGLLAQSGVDVVANNSVATASLDKAALKDILMGKTAYWPGGEAVTIVVLTDKTDAALQEATGMSGSAFKTFWQRLAFSGRGKQPKEADTVEKVLAIVAETKGAIAMVPAGTTLTGVKKIELK